MCFCCFDKDQVMTSFFLLNNEAMNKYVVKIYGRQPIENVPCVTNKPHPFHQYIIEMVLC